MVPGGPLPQASNNTDLQGASSTYAFNIENPCTVRYEIFARQAGEILSIDIIVKQMEADGTLSKYQSLVILYAYYKLE